jgi:hypothetical protein
MPMRKLSARELFLYTKIRGADKPGRRWDRAHPQDHDVMSRGGRRKGYFIFFSHFHARSLGRAVESWIHQCPSARRVTSGVDAFISWPTLPYWQQSLLGGKISSGFKTYWPASAFLYTILPQTSEKTPEKKELRSYLDAKYFLKY